MEDIFANRKAIPKPQSFIPIPNSRQKPATATRLETTRFGFDGTETTNIIPSPNSRQKPATASRVEATRFGFEGTETTNIIPIPNSRQKPETATRVETIRFGFEGTETTNCINSAGTSFETTETSTKYVQTTKKDEVNVQKIWKSSSLGQLPNYKVVNLLPQEKEKETSTETDGNRDEKGNTDGVKEEQTLKEHLEVLEAQKTELKALLSVKQRELEETIREERSKQERYFTLEIIKMQRKFREEISHLTQKFDEEKVLLEQYNKEQLKELTEQQCFEKDEKTACQIDEFKTKQEHRIQEMFSFAVAALFISVLSILISLLW